MQAQVREAVRSCHVCQQCKNERSGHRKDNFSNSRRLIRICGYALRLNKRSRYLPEFNEFCLQAVLKEVCFATSKSWSEHLQHLQSVLQLLRKNSLFARLSKCTFGSDQVDYLGYVISGNGVKADPKKIEDMVNWPKPVTIKELRGFLGLIGYYRRFVRDYGKIARPLTNLLKNGSFCWEGEADMAFQKLKEAMSRASVLALPDFEKPFIIETDASGVGVGAVLIQDKHPIAFFSRALATYERELLAIVAAIQRWKGYLLGRPFIIKTDHQALKHILEQKECHPTLQKWLSKLLGLQYTVMYNKGSDNQVADALSRRPNEVPLSSCLAISSVMSEWKERIILSVTTDGKLQAIMDYQLEDGNLVRKGRLVVGDDPTLKLSALGGHSGVHAINQRLSRVVYWKGMQAQVREAVRSCHVCQQCKNETTASPGLLQPIEIPKRFWTAISMDFIDGLPKSGGYTTILVVVDKLSKFGHFLPLKHPYTASSVAQLFMEQVSKLYGMPDKIISDRDPVFLSNFWKELFQAIKQP
ncbi:hypothetical protein OSB04_007717 [Centaurea solstitialis]|uniref:Integrase catalytic domain-containing protein n=1 Tax=Centaurea solstitialis TaxID=347529 RepID=A0AA38U3L8_9ASTR|nr:hypothetical protein OSB04_007717 [Centaurea solstitialis]